ncbi:hypothetical protein QQZ08_006651 [Neonectria magnoliae]|uniref:Uncharacterized protein n=1 Tax=Neonectria magnoliae TaxID=2732573 RepID=A0ABR1I1J9_9HYPO
MNYTTKRRSQDISSDEDDEIERIDLPIHIRKSPRRSRFPSSPEKSSNCKFDREAFAEFLANNLPLAFIKPEVKAALISDSNARLDEARRDGFSINDIVIGEDCLPFWPGGNWDPSVESLHSTIQRRLTDLERAKRLGDLVRSNIISKGNRRLDEARQLGVGLDSIFIGNGLLPVWEGEILIGLAPNHEDGRDDETSQNTSNFSTSTSSTCVESASDASTMVMLVDSDTSPSLITSSPINSDSDSDSDSSAETENIVSCPEEDCLYSIDLDNTVHDQAYYSDDEDALNIVHDVEVSGASQEYSLVDLQVYIAHEDDDVCDLPEMEMAINRDAFEHWHEMEEAIDIEISDAMMRCTGEIISIEEVDDEEAARVIAANPDAKMFLSPIPIIDESDEADDSDMTFA